MPDPALAAELKQHMPAYRPDIDGLRALAVLAVVFYHAGFDQISGGFVGVDVFFVISGYLITTIILKDLEGGHGFSIARFYERRARRIFPALFLVILAATLAALVIFTPIELEHYARTVIAATFFISNIFFWRETNYFASEADTEPLLHTWSLAVEEQFYIVFPIFLVLVHRYLPRQKIALLAIIGVISLLMGVIGIRYSEAAAFYLAPPRAWELMLGALLAVGAVPAPTNRPLRELVAFVGFGAILWSVLAFEAATTFPGIAALIPTLGTTALIWAGTVPGGSIVTRFLSLRPLVFVGLISYSFYLWHWPIFVFYYFTLDRFPSLAERWWMIAAAAALAIMSWQFVEQPFRRRSLLKTRAAVFSASGVGMAALGAVGLILVVQDGWPQRVPENLRAMATTDYTSLFEQGYDCIDAPLIEGGHFGLCPVGDTDVDDARVLIWGDSHALAMEPAFEKLATATEGGIVLASFPGCPHLFDVARIDYFTPCRQLNDALRRLIAERGIRKVILINGWTGILSDRDTEFQGVRSHDRASRIANVQAALPHTLEILHGLGVDVALVTPVPTPSRPVPKAITREALLGTTFELGSTVDEYQEDYAVLIQMIEANKGAIDLIVPVTEIFCENGYCPARDGMEPFYFDASHLSEAGLKRIEPGLTRILLPFLDGYASGSGSQGS